MRELRGECGHITRNLGIGPIAASRSNINAISPHHPTPHHTTLHHTTSHHTTAIPRLKIEARQSLQDNRGFYAGNGSTVTKKQVLARNRLLQQHQASMRSLPPMGGTMGNSTFNNTGASMMNTGASQQQQFGM